MREVCPHLAEEFGDAEGNLDLCCDSEQGRKTERVKNQCSCMIDDGDDGETQRRETLNI